MSVIGDPESVDIMDIMDTGHSTTPKYFGRFAPAQ